MRTFCLTPLLLVLTPLAGAATVKVQEALALSGLASKMMGPGAFASWRYVDCGLPTDAINIESIVVSPDPPEPGKNLTITVKGQATSTIEEGAYADVTVKLGLVKLLHKRFDVCEEARKAGASVTCPVEKGMYEVTQTVALPKEIPRAKFTVNVRGYTADEEDMVCLDLVADFLPGPKP